MGSPAYLRPENLSGLSLEAMGFLLMLSAGIDSTAVHSSSVTIESAKEELVAKGRLRYKPQAVEDNNNKL
jgi:hypothetical protein